MRTFLPSLFIVALVLFPRDSFCTDLTFGTIISPIAGNSYKSNENLSFSFEVKNINILPAELYSCSASIVPKGGGTAVYISSQEATNLQPGATRTITMPQQWLTVAGNYTVLLSIAFSEDINVANNIMVFDISIAQCCLSDSRWSKGNALTIVRNLSLFPSGEQLQKMRPGDLIGISCYVQDADNLIQRCMCINGNDTLISEKSFGPYADNVVYVWSLTGAGKLIEGEGSEKNSILYEIPLCDTNPVTIECRVRNPNNIKAVDEELVGSVLLRFSLSARIPDDPSSDNEIGNARSFLVTPQIAPFSPHSNEVIETIQQTDCVPAVPQWYDYSPITQQLAIRQKTSDITCPDYLVILSAEYVDYDSVVTACSAQEGQLCPVADAPFGKKYPDALHYVWKIKSGKGAFPLGNEGASVVFQRSKSEDAEIECEITDSKGQYADKQTIIINAKTVRQRNPKAYIGVGNISYDALGIDWGDNAQLLDAALVAQKWYETVGYEVEFDPYATRASASKVLENSCIQAFWIVGHGSNESGRKGVIDMTDGKDFMVNDVAAASRRKFQCPKHPFVREAILMGCYSARANWASAFFSSRVHGFQGALFNARWLIHEVLNWEKDKHYPPSPHDLRVP